MRRSRLDACRLALSTTVIVAMLATSCGSDSGDDSGGTATTQVPDESLTAQPGGTIVYGVEADTDGFDPKASRWAPSGMEMSLAIFDTVAAFDENAVAQPYLAEKIEHNADYTEWVVTLRKGVKFHDGSTLGSEDLLYVINAHLASGLTKYVFGGLDKAEAIDDLSVRFTMKQPWVVFPATLTTQAGVVPPENFDKDWDDAANLPVGTGPFMIEEWVKGDHLNVVKNPDYWRTDDNGVRLPYLDRIEFTKVTSNPARASGLLTGDIDVFHATDGATIKAASSSDTTCQAATSEGEEDFLMLNTQAKPLDDVRIRRAIAHSIDTRAYIELFGEGVDRPADSAFNPNNPYYAKAPDYPTLDVDKAKELVANYEADTGEDAKFTMRTTNDPVVQQIGQWLAAGIEESGIDVEIESVEQTDLVLGGVFGNYQVNYWRQYAAPDPDIDYVWWIGKNADAPGKFALNMTRLQDEEIDAALNEGRESDDPEVRKEAYAKLQRRWGQLVPYVWLMHTTWQLCHSNKVHGLTTATLPDGSKSLGLGGYLQSMHLLCHTWVEKD